jgi:hypothetical protein
MALSNRKVGLSKANRSLECQAQTLPAQSSCHPAHPVYLRGNEARATAAVVDPYASRPEATYQLQKANII